MGVLPRGASSSLYIYIDLSLSIYPSIHPSIYLSIYLCIYLSIYLSQLLVVPPYADGCAVAAAGRPPREPLPLCLGPEY